MEILWPPPSVGEVPLGETHPYLAQAYWNGSPVSASVGWNWDFGDGSQDSSDNPAEHQYDTGGTYIVTAAATYMGQEASSATAYSTAPDAGGIFPLAATGAGDVCDPWPVQVSGVPGWPAILSSVTFRKSVDGAGWIDAPNVFFDHWDDRTWVGTWLTHSDP